MLTQDELKKVVDYNSASGEFRWLIPMGPRHIGDIAGTKCRRGYWSICIDRQIYKSHRLAWFYVYGVWPRGQLDHIDRNKSNNSISNLRDVSQEINQRNRISARKDSKTGLLGVSIWSDGRKGFKAQISINQKPKYLGTFDTAELANEAYLSAKQIHHKGCVQC